jgi:hypothetical protein
MWDYFLQFWSELRIIVRTLHFTSMLRTYWQMPYDVWLSCDGFVYCVMTSNITFGPTVCLSFIWLPSLVSLKMWNFSKWTWCSPIFGKVQNSHNIIRRPHWLSASRWRFKNLELKILFWKERAHPLNLGKILYQLGQQNHRL